MTDLSKDFAEVKEAKENADRPGLPDYAGPKSGGFFAVHHYRSVEWSDDIGKWVAYIQARKPANEIPIRLYNLLHLPFVTKEWLVGYNRQCAPLWVEFARQRDLLWEKYAHQSATLSWLVGYERQCAPFWVEFARQCALVDAPILEYVRQRIPDHAWKDGQLQFPEAK